MSSKKVQESYTTMTQLVMPNDTNPLGNLMGGNLLKWMDIASSISAAKHAESIVVTAAVDNVSFKRSIGLGEVVTINSKITRSFNTSMEVYLEVFSHNLLTNDKIKCNEAFYTFVALDHAGNKVQVPGVITENDDEKKLFDGAKRRREMRLILAGRMNPEDSADLKSIFLKGFPK